MQILLDIFFIIISLIISIIILPFRLIIFLVRKLFGIPPKPGPRPIPLSDLEDLEARTDVDEDSASLSVNLDGLEYDEQDDFLEAAIEQTDFELYKGHVKHGYDVKNVSNKDICPRCQSPTVQMYSNFVYATQIAPRVMFAPAGYFCQQCPTVIIDQGIIRGGVSRKFKFRGILGVDSSRKGNFEGFDTWNGKKSVYLIDEVEGGVELTTTDQVPDDYVSLQTLYDTKQHFKKKREKARKQKKLAKQTKKKKRRKK